MFEVIVAYFNNNSFEKIISEIKTDKITIYDSSKKYNNQIYENIVNIENNNGEGGAYLTHIINNYNNISDHTLFVQDDIYNHVKSIEEYILLMNHHSKQTNFFFQYKTLWRRQLHFGNYLIVNGYTEIFDEIELYKEKNTKYSKYLYQNGIINMEDYKFIENFPKIKPDKFAIKHTCERFNIFLPEMYFASSNASFIASKEAILKRPKEFYINLRTWLLEKNSNIYILELIWPLILTENIKLVYENELITKKYY
jgi:hypothetical protein